MPVAFDPLIVEPVDRRALDNEIAGALIDAGTRIFLDTNVLMWTYSLHKGARTDLCEWLKTGPQSGRIHVPRRVIHEFSAHRDASEKLYPFGQEFKPLNGLMERFEQMAPLVADDAWALSNGFTDRATYLQQVAHARVTLRKLVTPVTKGEKLEKLHQQLIPVFNSLVLDSDVFSNLASLREKYEARSELRIPPGFKDAKKGKANEPANLIAGAPAMAGANRFGDLAIWDEILEFVRATEPPIQAVIIITHDTKPDWSYTPKKIIDSDGRTKPNPQSGPSQLSVAQPLLYHELTRRTGATALYIITVPQLAVIANAHDVGFRFEALAQAVQVEADEDEESDQATAATEDSATEEDATNPEIIVEDEVLGDEVVEVVDGVGVEGGGIGDDGDVVAFLANPPAVALADGDYVLDPNGPTAFDATIKGLRSNNWYLQNPAIRDGVMLLGEGKATLLQAFVFGRNLYQAAVGTAADAMRLLEDFTNRSSEFPAPLAAAVYAGALFELYFDKLGELRIVPKDGQIGPLFRHQTLESLAPAIAFIRQRLEGAHLMVRPSSEPPVVHLTVSFNDQGAITAVMLGDIALTENENAADIGATPLPEKAGAKRLRSLVASYFAAPDYQIDLQPEFQDVRPVADLQFIRWNPIEGPGFA